MCDSGGRVKCQISASVREYGSVAPGVLNVQRPATSLCTDRLN